MPTKRSQLYNIALPSRVRGQSRKQWQWLILSRFGEKSSKVFPHLGGLSAGGRVGDPQTGSQGVEEVAPGEVVLEAETPQQDLSKTSPGWLQS